MDRASFVCVCLLHILGPVGLLSQDRWMVEGRVFDDETRMPVPGVNVLVRGERSGAMTDTTGYFQLQFQSGSPRILVFSHVAYRKTAWRVEFDSTREAGFRVYLIPDTIRLGEVVVTAKRQLVPTKAAERRASYAISGEEFERLGEERMERALMYFLPFIVKRPEERMKKGGEDFTLYVNGEWKESLTLDDVDPFSVRRVMVWEYWGIATDIDMFPLGFPPHGTKRVILIETSQK